MGNDIMVGVNTNASSFSRITLAFFIDFGLYNLVLPIKDSYTSLFFYGYHKGDSFFATSSFN